MMIKKRDRKKHGSKIFAHFLLLTILVVSIITYNITQTYATQFSNPIFSVTQDIYYTGTHNLEGFQNLSLWYAKINTPSISTLYVAYKSNDNAIPPPFLSVLAQHFVGSNNTEIYFATSLIYMEFFNDTNENGVLDYNTEDGTNEIRYTIVLNASNGVIPSDIIKKSITTDTWEIVTYEWSYTYLDLQAVLTQPNGSVVEMNNSIVTFFIRNFTLTYTLNISTNLETNTTRYRIKQNIEILGPEFYLYDFTTGYTKTITTMFNDLGIALLFAATVSSNKELSIVSNNNLINSSDPTFKETQIENASLISVEDNTKFIDLYLNDTYLLFPSNTTHEVKSAVYPKESIKEYTNGAFSSFIDNRIYEYIREVYSNESVYDVIPNMTLSRSDFIYRISYANWSGESIIHDPTIEAYPHFMLGYLHQVAHPGAFRLGSTALDINTLNMILTITFGILLAIFATYRRKRIIYPDLEKHYEKTVAITPIIHYEYIEF